MVVRLLPKQEARVRFPYPAPKFIMTQEILKYVIKDKIALGLLIGLGVFTLLATVVILFWLQPSNVQIPIRYSGYENSLYSARWYERLSFVVFLFLQTATTAVLAMLMHARSYKILAYFFLAVAIFIIIITTIVTWAVTQTVSL